MKVAVVGAGLIGRLLTYYLLQENCNVTIFEQGGETGETSAGHVAAGMVAPYSEYDSHNLEILNLGLDSIQQWREIAAHLSAENFYTEAGTLTIAFAQDKNELSHRQRCLNKVLPEEIRLLRGRELQAYEQELQRNDLQGFFLSGEGHVDGRKFYKAMTNYFKKQDLQWKTFTQVQEIEPGKVILAEEQYSFDWVFDCRGLGAKDAFPELRGIRGELIWLQADKVNLQRPIRFLHPRYPIYLVPRLGNQYILGATTIESEETSPITVRSTLELLTAVYSLHPEFSEARMIHTEVGCRPALLTNRPRIIYQPRLIRINGLYRHGYLYGPSLAREVVNVIHHGLEKIKYNTSWETTS